MVIQGSTPRAPVLSESSKTSISHLFFSATTFRGATRSRVTNSYIAALVYTCSIALWCEIIICVLKALSSSSGKVLTLSFVRQELMRFACFSILILFVSFIAAFFNSRILGTDIEAKDTLIFVSSMTYAPLYILLHLIHPIIGNIAGIAWWLLNVMYLRSTYTTTFADERESTIHYVYIAVAVMTIEVLLLGSNAWIDRLVAE